MTTWHGRPLESNEMVITTPWGPARLVVTQADSCYFDANGEINVSQEEKPGLTVNGVNYGVRAHLYLQGNEWVMPEPWKNLSGHRRDTWAGGDLSDSARRTLTKGIPAIVTEALSGAPEVVRAGTVTGLRDEQVRAVREVEKCTGALAAAQCTLGNIKRRLEAIGEV